MVGARNTPPPSWISAAAKRVDFDPDIDSVNMFTDDDKDRKNDKPISVSDFNLGLGERALSAAGAAFISAVIVNPLDVAKTRLQAQAAGVAYQAQCTPACSGSDKMIQDLKATESWNRAIRQGEPSCRPQCSQYEGTFDVFYKVIRQEGISRLWRGTNASLALAIPTVGIYLPCYDLLRNYMEEYTIQKAPSLTPYVPLVAGSIARSLACITCYPVDLARTRMQAFRDNQGIRPAGVLKTLIEATPVKSANSIQNLQNYRILWTGLGAQLARDVPFSAICWATLEPIRRRVISDVPSTLSIFGANFSAGFVAGSLAAAATCPLDVARTRRQIETDPARQMRMTTRQTLAEIWRDGGWRGLFTGVGPRVARAGPSVGIVVSFYEVVKHVLYERRLDQ